MHNPTITLTDLFSHWRDQPLLELQAALNYLSRHPDMQLTQLGDHKVVISLFSLDDQGRPGLTRRELALGHVLERYVGLGDAMPGTLFQLTGALMLERERQLRSRLHSARRALASVLEPWELDRLKALPVLAGLTPEVRSLLVAAARAPDGCLDYPATAFASTLGTPAVGDFVEVMHRELGWPTRPGIPNLHLQGLALLTLALPWALDPTEDCHGFDFYAPRLIGASVRDLLVELKAHLSRHLPGCPSDAFGLIRFLLAEHAPAELSPLGLPGELAWTSSITWVLLSHGVTLAETLEPGRSGLLRVDELLALPARVGEQGTHNGLSKSLIATLAPALARWSKATQQIERLPAAQSTQRTLRMLLKHLDAMDNAQTSLGRPMPRRLEMAAAELQRRGIAPDMRFVEARDRVRQSLLINNGVSAFDAFASGLAAGPNPTLMPALRHGHDGRLHEPWVNIADIPDLPAAFETAFSTWKAEIVLAFEVMSQRLLGDLPLADQLRLEQHSVTVCQLTVRNEQRQKESAAYGIVLYIDTSDGAWFYELLPSAGWCRIHADPERRLPVPTTDGDAQELPFDWAAHRFGGLPQQPTRHEGWLEPKIRIGAVANPAFAIFRNARLIARHCARQVDASLEKLRPGARGTLPGETVHPVPEQLKALVPFWTSLEMISEGYQEKRSWLVVLGLFGLMADAITLGLYGRLSALGVRFVMLALRQGPRAATRLLGPRLRAAARDAMDTLAPLANGEQPEALVLGTVAALRRAHAATLRRATLPLANERDIQRRLPGPPLTPFGRSTVQVGRFENDAPIAFAVEGVGASFEPRLVDLQTSLPYGPVLDVIDDTGRLGRLPHELPVLEREGRRYLPDPAPTLDKRWLRWGDETWLECSGRYYRLREADGQRPARFERAPCPYERPPLSQPLCRLKRGLPPLLCGIQTERQTRNFTELTAQDTIAPGAVEWFDARKVVPDSNGRFVDRRRIFQSRPGQAYDQVIEPLGWERYTPVIHARVVAGNEVFLRIEVVDGLVSGIDDRRQLSAVRLEAIEGGQFHLVTCVDDGVYYHGVFEGQQEHNIILNKLPEGEPTEADTLSLAEELKTLFNGCWDANLHIRKRGMAVVQSHLQQVEAALAAGQADVEQLMTRRFRLATTPAQAALFAKYPRRTFIQRTRQFVAADYTRPLTQQTPLEVRQRIADHLNRLVGTPGALDAETVLSHERVANLPPKGKNIAFLWLSYRDGRPLEVYYSVSGGARRGTDLPLARRLGRELQTAPNQVVETWIAEDGTRYINCRGQGSGDGEEVLLHLPDLSESSSLNSGDFNDRRLDSERNILSYMEQHAPAWEAVAEAALFSRFPTCDSCTTLISQYREHFPAGRFSVYEGPGPTPAEVASGQGLPSGE